jgi:hypothetical protein
MECVGQNLEYIYACLLTTMVLSIITAWTKPVCYKLSSNYTLIQTLCSPICTVHYKTLSVNYDSNKNSLRTGDPENSGLSNMQLGGLAVC